jgi:AhpD family alkylhydroperoxidase
MSWVPLLKTDSLTPEAREMAESGRAQYGQLLETWRVLFHRPEIFAAYLPFLRAVAGPGSVDLGTKDVCAILVGKINGCRYTVSHRCASAARNGVATQTLAHVMNGSWALLEPRMRDSLEFTNLLTITPPQVSYREEPGLIPESLRSALSSWYSDDQLVELTMSISVWNALARFHRTMQLDLDMPAPPRFADPAYDDGADL